MTKIDICIPTYRKREDIQKQINEIEKNTHESHRIIASCQPLSASRNRNYCLSYANSEIIVMLDDDVTGYFPHWLSFLVQPMFKDTSIIISSARLLDSNKNIAHMMGAYKIPKEATGIHEAERFNYKNYQRVATACIAIRKNDIKFNECFKGSGYEDTTWMNRINEKFPNMKIVVNCDCKLIHLNEEKEQGGENFEHNKEHYLSLFPDDKTVVNQKDWTARRK